MAGLRADISKKQHRERAQPQRRRRLGLLEKKKDYRLRAADYHRKQAQLKILKEKAKNYNEDEYYHAMVHKKTDDKGILISEQELETLSQDEMMLLKTQDTGYLNTITQREAKKIEKELHSATTFKSSGQHTVFVESKSELEDFDPVKYFDTNEAFINEPENRLRVEQLAGIQSNGQVDDSPIVQKLDDPSGYQKTKRDLHKVKRLRRIQRRMQRQKKLQGLNSKLDLQRQLMRGGNVKKIRSKQGKTVYKWKNQRKK